MELAVCNLSDVVCMKWPIDVNEAPFWIILFHSVSYIYIIWSLQTIFTSGFIDVSAIIRGQLTVNENIPMVNDKHTWTINKTYSKPTT